MRGARGGGRPLPGGAACDTESAARRRHPGAEGRWPGVAHTRALEAPTPQDARLQACCPPKGSCASASVGGPRARRRGRLRARACRRQRPLLQRPACMHSGSCVARAPPRDGSLKSRDASCHASPRLQICPAPRHQRPAGRPARHRDGGRGAQRRWWPCLSLEAGGGSGGGGVRVRPNAPQHHSASRDSSRTAAGRPTTRWKPPFQLCARPSTAMPAAQRSWRSGVGTAPRNGADSRHPSRDDGGGGGVTLSCSYGRSAQRHAAPVPYALQPAHPPHPACCWRTRTRQRTGERAAEAEGGC